MVKMEKSLLILGAGTHGEVVKEIALACGYKKIAFLDDNSNIAIGKIKNIDEFLEYTDVVVSIGIGDLRECLLNQALKLGFQIPVLIHPSAYVSPSASIGMGTIVEPKSIINSNVIIDEGVIVSVGAIIDHNAKIDKYSQVNAGCIIKSGASVNSYVKLEVGEVVYK